MRCIISVARFKNLLDYTEDPLKHGGLYRVQQCRSMEYKCAEEYIGGEE